MIDWLLSLTGQLESWILTLADAWWVYLVVYGFAAFDGFFPSVPSESTIVTLSSLWSSSGRPSILLIGLAAWLGAWTGDNVGYLVGNKIGYERFKFLREGKGRAAVEAADRGLQKRALVFLMTARYIPFGRTAVNLVAGAVHYPHRNFWPRSLLSTFVWAVYSCAIGALAGAWFEDNHLLGITVALIAAVVMALLVERLITAVHRALDRRAERRAAEADTNADTERDAALEESTAPQSAATPDAPEQSATEHSAAVSLSAELSTAEPDPSQQPDVQAPADSDPFRTQSRPGLPGGEPIAVSAESPSAARGEESPA
ncbi:VTT domain-containing protein [Brachybacterium sp. AOP42-C2-15]|uniref:DedA family protein n=1 Tax=unclassified Brachybacterium TaxID=2623841 RepID=UPI003F8DEC47